MTPDDFNKKASEYVGVTYIDAWNLVSPAILLLHTVAERESATARTAYWPGMMGRNKHTAAMQDQGRLVDELDTTLPRAVCRCVAAWLGWGEIEEAPSGQP